MAIYVDPVGRLRVEDEGVSPPVPSSPHPPKRHRQSAFDLFAGVVLPLVTILFELATRVCTGTFLDPLPSVWHAGMVLLVPAANALLWWRKGSFRRRAFATAFSLVVSLIYTICFLPLLPLAIIGLIVVIGIFPLAPLLAFITAIRHCKRLGEERGAWSVLGWVPVAVLIALAVHSPVLITGVGATLASSENPSEQARGLALLRRVGVDRQLLELCYGRGRSLGALLGSVTSAQAREIYYRVTGHAFSSVPPPAHATRLFAEWEWAPDENQGGTGVGRHLKGLSIDSSVMDGSVDPLAALGYLEWTMEFRNDSRQQREARALIQLPRDGVVSRVTLWVNGEPREAAFGGRSAVRQAYERVVRARQDPLLVTTAGTGRVLVQCFPVVAGGRMKIRFGITAPVTGERWDLPRILERNFADGTRHSIWVDAGEASARRTLATSELAQGVPLPKASSAEQSWTPDPAEPKRFHVQQRILQRPAPRHSKLVVVVDGSASMRPFAAQLRRAWPGEMILASDRPRRTSQLQASDFGGGADNVPALALAQDDAPEPGAAILWIHGPQPVEIRSPQTLRQVWARRPGSAPIYSLQLVPGPNIVLTALDGYVELRTVEGTAEEAIRRLAGGGQEVLYVRERRSGRAGVGHRTSAHLARLWAAEQVARTGSAELAARYQLVTPVSGAVVLENDRQYQENALKPVEAATVPTVPEPETWALMVLAVALVAITIHQRRKPCRPL